MNTAIRKIVVRHLFVSLTLLILGCQSRKKEQLNVLFILADDFGYHDLGMTGSQLYDTPNIDRLVESGVWFKNAYCGKLDGGNAAVKESSRKQHENRDVLMLMKTSLSP